MVVNSKIVIKKEYSMRKRIWIFILMLVLVGCAKTENKQVNEQEKIIETEADTTQENEDEPTIEEEKIEEETKFIRYDLEVPQYVQETSYYCSVAALQSVMAYHGIYARQDELAQELNTDPITGTEYEDLARVATQRIFPNGNGTYTSVIPTSDTEREVFEQRLIQDMETSDPVFVSINNRWMYEDVPDQVHQVVVVGAEIENRKITKVNFFDPSYTRQDSIYGGLKACSADELWYAMIHNPEPGYVY